MKKIFAFIILLIITPFVLDKILSKNQISLNPQTIIPTSRDDDSLSQIKIENNEYRYGIFSNNNSNKVTYKINLTDKFTSLDIVEKNNCKFLINGGFYDTQDNPIGLTIENGNKISDNQTNALFNGYVSSSRSAEIRIINEPPKHETGFIFQTGPLLIVDEKIQSLKIKNDESKRRMVAIEGSDGNMYFAVIINKESLHEGPLLSQLPQAISQISKKENIQIKNAINLDGGSASSFITPEVQIRELRTIGSYLCFK